MERKRPKSSLFEPAIYRICILGTLDKNRSDYYGGMIIENVSDLNNDAITILTGPLADQSALVGVFNSLHDIGCPILSVEYMGTNTFRTFPDTGGGNGEHERLP